MNYHVRRLQRMGMIGKWSLNEDDLPPFYTSEYLRASVNAVNGYLDNVIRCATEGERIVDAEFIVGEVEYYHTWLMDQIKSRVIPSIEARLSFQKMDIGS